MICHILIMKFADVCFVTPLRCYLSFCHSRNHSRSNWQVAFRFGTVAKSCLPCARHF